MRRESADGPPPEVAAAFDAMPPGLRPRMAALRATVLRTAAELGVGPLTETLKWGEPAYLTEASRAGTTLRLAPVKGRAGMCGLFVHCRSGVADAVRARCGARLETMGDRAVLIPAEGPWDADAVAEAAAVALTWKRRGRA